MNPNGLTICNDSEKIAIDKLHDVVNIKSVLIPVHGLECRVADVFYCLKDYQDNYDMDSEIFFAEQTKSSTAGEEGQCNFHVNIEEMINILNVECLYLAFQK
jgi:hypothetical protein